MIKILTPIIGSIIILGMFFIFSNKENIQQKQEAIKEHKLKEQQEQEKEQRCLNEYNRLEQSYQDATSWFNDDETQLSEIKTTAIKLQREDCDRYTVGGFSNLIRKCDNQL